MAGYDDVSIQRAVAPLLRSRGYEVDVVGTGAEAASAVVDHAPDLVVLDLGLPDLEGVEVFGRYDGGGAGVAVEDAHFANDVAFLQHVPTEFSRCLTTDPRDIRVVDFVI